MVVLGVCSLALAVIPFAWPNGTMPNLSNQLNLVRWLLVPIVPIGLSMVSLAVGRLRLTTTTAFAAQRPVLAMIENLSATVVKESPPDAA
jgi:hypothetical protein